MHRRKDQLSGHAILGCVPPDDEAKVGATLARVRFEASSGSWSFASLRPHALVRDGIPSQGESPYNGDHLTVGTLVLCCAGQRRVSAVWRELTADESVSYV